MAGHEQQDGHSVDALGDDLVALLYDVSVEIQALERCLEQVRGPGQKELGELLNTIRDQQRLSIRELRHYLGEHLLGYGEPALFRDP